MTVAVSDPQSSIAQTIKKIGNIATLPEVTARIISTVEDPKSNAAQLHKIVAHDPALVTRILKVVNSAFYGLPGQIASIERAIVLLGLNAVKNIAVAASIGQLFRGAKLCDGFTPRDLWTHCVAVGVTASFGTVLLTAGTKGRRYALPHATIHMHQPLGGAQGQATDIEIAARQILRQKASLNQILANSTGQPLEVIERDTDRDFYLDATAAVEYGLVDQVLEVPEKPKEKAKS